MSGAPAPPGAAGVVLAAGAGTRLRPLTLLRPKALCPVGGVPLLDLALDRLAALVGHGEDRLAANAHHGADQVAAHLDGRPVRVSVERGRARGTAGALGLLRDWLDGRDVVLTNADAWLPEGLGGLLAGWDGERCRLLCTPVPGRGDFTAPDGRALRYVGACVLPWRLVRGLGTDPSGLYEVLWRAEYAAGRLDLVTGAGIGTAGTAVDCGTPADYLAANLGAVRRAGGSVIDRTALVRGRCTASVIGAGAVVEGDVERGVVWPGARVAPGERLVDAVRAAGPDGPVTVRCAAAVTPTR